MRAKAAQRRHATCASPQNPEDIRARAHRGAGECLSRLRRDDCLDPGRSRLTPGCKGGVTSGDTSECRCVPTGGFTKNPDSAHSRGRDGKRNAGGDASTSARADAVRRGPAPRALLGDSTTSHLAMEHAAGSWASSRCCRSAPPARATELNCQRRGAKNKRQRFSIGAAAPREDGRTGGRSRQPRPERRTRSRSARRRPWKKCRPPAPRGVHASASLSKDAVPRGGSTASARWSGEVHQDSRPVHARKRRYAASWRHFRPSGLLGRLYECSRQVFTHRRISTRVGRPPSRR